MGVWREGNEVSEDLVGVYAEWGIQGIGIARLKRPN